MPQFSSPFPCVVQINRMSKMHGHDPSTLFMLHVIRPTYVHFCFSLVIIFIFFLKIYTYLHHHHQEHGFFYTGKGNEVDFPLNKNITKAFGEKNNKKIITMMTQTPKRTKSSWWNGVKEMGWHRVCLCVPLKICMRWGPSCFADVMRSTGNLKRNFLFECLCAHYVVTLYLEVNESNCLFFPLYPAKYNKLCDEHMQNDYWWWFGMSYTFFYYAIAKPMTLLSCFLVWSLLSA